MKVDNCIHSLHWPDRGPPVLFSQLMKWRTHVEWRAQPGGRRGCQCVKGCWLFGGGLAPPMQEVGCVEDVINVIVCLLVLTRLCSTIGIADFRWASSGRSKFLGEGLPWGTGWYCCGCVLAPSGPVSGPLSMLAATPCDWMRVVWYLLPHGCLSCGLQGH